MLCFIHNHCLIEKCFSKWIEIIKIVEKKNYPMVNEMLGLGFNPTQFISSYKSTHNDVLGLSGINRMDEGNNGGGYSRGPPVRGFHFIF